MYNQLLEKMTTAKFSFLVQVNIFDAVDCLGVQGPTCAQVGAVAQRLAGDVPLRELGGQREQHLAAGPKRKLLLSGAHIRRTNG